MRLSLPQRPRCKVVIGKISGGANHGKIAYDASLGFEIRSDSYKMVKSIYKDIKDIVDGIGHENEVELNIKTISNLKAARLKFNHPLVKNSAAILGASLGFLRWNFRPAKIFMGDGGAMFLGFSLATLGLKLRLPEIDASVRWLVPILVLGVPIFDTSLDLCSAGLLSFIVFNVYEFTDFFQNLRQNLSWRHALYIGVACGIIYDKFYGALQVVLGGGAA